MSDPYGQPSGQPDPYGQQPYGQPYGQAGPYGAPADGRRPGTVTAAAWITIVFSAIVAVIFGFTTLALIVARDQVITEMEKVPEFQEAGIDPDAAVGVLVAVMLGLVVWSVIAIVLAVFVLRRSSVARILLVISAVVAALLSLLGITSGITVVTLVAAIATIVLLFVGGAGDWFSGSSGRADGYGGHPQQFLAPEQGGASPYGSSYGQPDPYGQPPAPGQNPYGQPDSSGQQPPPSQNPYGQNPYGQPPADGQGGSEHPPRDYPGR